MENNNVRYGFIDFLKMKLYTMTFNKIQIRVCDTADSEQKVNTITICIHGAAFYTTSKLYEALKDNDIELNISHIENINFEDKKKTLTHYPNEYKHNRRISCTIHKLHKIHEPRNKIDDLLSLIASVIELP